MEQERATLIRDRIFVVERGVVSTRGKIVFAGQVIGDEGFLPAIRQINPDGRTKGAYYDIQRRKFFAVSLTYCVLMIIDKGKLLPLLRKYRGSQQKLTRSLVRFVARRTISNLADAVSRNRKMREQAEARGGDDAAEGGRKPLARSFSLSGFDSEFLKIDYMTWLLSLENADVEKAAVKIQRNFRGLLARKKLADQGLNPKAIKKRARAGLIPGAHTLKMGLALKDSSSGLADAWEGGSGGGAKKLDPIASTTTTTATGQSDGGKTVDDGEASPHDPPGTPIATTTPMAPTTPATLARVNSSMKMSSLQGGAQSAVEEQMHSMAKMLKALKRDMTESMLEVKNKLEDLEDGLGRAQ